MKALLVSDLHYDLPKLDWVLAEAAGVDLLIVAGDLLEVSSPVPLDAQITVVLEYLHRLAELTTVVACSGNHDLDHRTDHGEKATAWLHEAAAAGVTVDGQSIVLDGWTVSACAWWEGPHSLEAVREALESAPTSPARRWLWAYHGPPEGPLAWTGSRHFGDPELPGLIDAHRPDIVLCGHIHQAPYVDGGAWNEQRGRTWLFNSGHQSGPIPAHTFFDLSAGSAEWWSFEGAGSITLDPVDEG